MSRWHHPGREEEAFQRSLNDLGTDYVDLVCVNRARKLNGYLSSFIFLRLVFNSLAASFGVRG